MKKQILLGALLFATMNTIAQNVIEDLYIPKHQLSDFGLTQKVKTSVVTSYYENDKGEYIASGYPSENIAYHFNQDGLLTAEYYIRGANDTTVFVVYSYNKKNLLTSINNYRNDTRGQLKTKDKSSWTKETQEFTYNDNGQLLSNKMMGYSKYTWTHEYDKEGILVKSTNVQGESATLSKTCYRKYSFDKKSNLFVSMEEVNELEDESWRNPTGVTLFKYDGQTLIEKEYKGSKHAMPVITRFNKSGKTTENYVGDSTQKAVYSEKTYSYFDVKKFSFDDLGNTTSIYSHTNGDGVFKNRTTVEYKFDENKNWTQSISTRKDVIAHSRDDDRISRDKVERVISYYK